MGGGSYFNDVGLWGVAMAWLAKESKKNRASVGWPISGGKMRGDYERHSEARQGPRRSEKFGTNSATNRVD